MTRYVSLRAGNEMAEWQDEVVVLSPKSHTYIGLRGAARDVLLALHAMPAPVSPRELAQHALAHAPAGSPSMTLCDAETAIDACLQCLDDEGLLQEVQR